jgi:triacylglycerol lipase
MQLVAWLAAALAHFDPSAVPVDPAKRPVILVHGIHSSGPDMARLAKHLRSEGRLVLTPTLTPNGGAAKLEVLAAQLSAFADKELPGRQFDLVGFSMGGLISRYYVQRLGGLQRVSHFVTMATPHQGTKMAHLRRAPGVLQMRPGSDFLRDLASDAETLRKVKFTSFYTPLDTIILPARSSEVPQARNVRFWAAAHPSWILEKRCLRAVAKAHTP